MDKYEEIIVNWIAETGDVHSVKCTFESWYMKKSCTYLFDILPLDELIKYRFKYNIDINKVYNKTWGVNDYSILLKLIRANNKSDLKKLLLCKELKLDYVNEDGNSLLHLTHHWEIVEILLMHMKYEQITRRNNYGETAVMLASRCGDHKRLKLLLQYYPFMVQQTCILNYTPLKVAHMNSLIYDDTKKYTMNQKYEEYDVDYKQCIKLLTDAKIKINTSICFCLLNHETLNRNAIFDIQLIKLLGSFIN